MTTSYDIMNMLPNRHLSAVVAEDDDYYDYYVESNAVDPGQTLLIISLCVSLSLIFGLPLFVKVGKYLSNLNNESDTEAATSSGRHHEEDDDLSCIQRCGKMSYSAVHYVLENAIRRRKRGTRFGENVDQRRGVVSRGMTREAQYSTRHRQQEAIVDVDPAGGALEVVLDPAENNDDHAQTMGLSPVNEKGENQLQLNDHDNSTPPAAHLRPAGIGKSLQYLWTIARYDNESKRILRLATPFTISAVVETFIGLVELGIVSKYLGTDSMIAFAMVDVIVGISSEFLGGWIEAVSSLGSMAYGAERYELVGQYVQTSCIIYSLCELPFAFIWGMSIGKILLLMGFEESVAALAQDYVYIGVVHDIIGGINEAVLDFLEVVEREQYANFMYCLHSFTELAFFAIFAIYLDADIVVIGLMALALEALFFFLNILIPSKLGWLEHFELGLFGQCSFKNRSMLKDLFETALPLAFGSLLAYAEWEILTVFAAFLGPAEVATWAILGYVWEVFESTTEAFGDAGEVRVAYQLGKGRPALAKLSAHKSIFMSVIMAFCSSAVFLSLSNHLPKWLTTDPTLQGMMLDLFPLIALSNVTMNMGMICWALVGAQGRYSLATKIHVGCSLLITIPLGAICTLGLKINLQGLTFAVIIGYSVTGMLLSTLLLMTDWEKMSRMIKDKLDAHNDSHSDDDSSCSDDDSSSSSSSSSSIHQAFQSRSIPVGYFEIPPATPGSVVPPPPPPPQITPGRCPNLLEVSTKRQRGMHKRSGSLTYIPGHVTPPRTPTRRPRSMTPTSDKRTSFGNPTRRPRPRSMASDQQQVKSLSKLRTLGTQHAGLPNPPGSPTSPGSHAIPRSPMTPGSTATHQESTRSSASSNVERDRRVVRGRRTRIG